MSKAARALGAARLGSPRAKWLTSMCVLWTLIWWSPLPLHHVFGAGYPTVQAGYAIFGVACLITFAYGFQMARTNGELWILRSAAAGTVALWSWSWLMILTPLAILGLFDGDLGEIFGVALLGVGVSLFLAIVCFLILGSFLVVGKLFEMGCGRLRRGPRQRHRLA